MDFDEYEYLEKTVEDQNNQNDSSAKKEKEKGYRRRDRGEDVDLDEENRSEENRKSKKSRGEGESGRERSSRHEKDRNRSGERESERDRDRDRDRERVGNACGEAVSVSQPFVHYEDDNPINSTFVKYPILRNNLGMIIEYIDQEVLTYWKIYFYMLEWDLSGTDEVTSITRKQKKKKRGKGKFKEKKEAVEPEADPERDQRTVFAYQMPLKATERDAYEFFSKAGKVRDVRLIMDRNSRRSKGVGYIEFYDAMSVPMAIAMSGQLLLGQPVMVKPSEAEKNLVQSNTSGGASGGLTGPYGAVDRKLYVGNLHFNMTEFQLKQIFEAFGPVELVQLPTDPETGHCKGFGFVQFAQLEHAKAAQSLNGKLEIAGRTIKVSSVTDHVGMQDSGAKTADFDDDDGGGLVSSVTDHVGMQDSGAKTADFDDDDGGGLALNAQSRALLMQKLDRSGIASSVAGSVGTPMLNGSSQQPISLPINGPAAVPGQVFPAQIITALEPIGSPSECLLLKNMFDPATESDPEFDMDIKEDVEEECSKYGRVKHIYVDKNSAGYVYLRFENVEGAQRAQQAMHQRWFARKMISAIFLQPYEYDAKFKGAA
ncbi:unnamed protein product [Ilex paraguariensis]|uniref:RRM domain-containing protein n=1 Tax=Ilex paraguariensis TaxID=185542 RepID=A0ABC8TKA5_9AQUA